MNSSKKKKPFLTVSLALGLLCLGFFILQAQVKVQGPTPKISCNNNGNCENGEYDGSVTSLNQLCPDCRPKTYPPLIIDENSRQLVTRYSYSPSIVPQIYQYKYLNGQYKDAWASSLANFPYGAACIGDVDGDGFKEIVGFVESVRKVTAGSGKNAATTSYYDYKIIVFGSPGVDSLPYYESPFLGETTYRFLRDCLIADVDNDGKPELAFIRGSKVDIYQWMGMGFVWKWSTPFYGEGIFTIDSGDANSDGKNDLILAMNGPVVWTCDNGAWTSVNANPVTVYAKGQTMLAMDYARTRDADNDGKNEIVGGGNNNRLMVWKWDALTLGYKVVFVSGDLGGFTQGVDVGDLDGNGTKEIVIGSFSGPGKLYVFEFSGSTYFQRNFVTLDGGVVDLRTGDLDSDGRDEVTLIAKGLKIYDFNGTSLRSGSFSLAFAALFGDIGIEIR